MGALTMDIVLLFALMLFNGLFALAEMSLVAANKLRLQQWADDNRPGARRALALASNPTRLLSTMQVGITGAGVLAGAFGDAIIAQPIEQWLRQLPWLAPYAHGAAIALAVAIITLASLLIGELIPKRIALLNPETFACLLSAPVQGVSRLVSPLVAVLSFITDTSLRMFGVKPSTEPVVTQEEIRVLMEQGAEAGVLENEEHAIVNRVFNLDDQRIRAIMTPRSDIVYLDTTAEPADLKALLLAQPFSHFPVCAGSIDDTLGVVHARALVAQALDAKKLDIASCAQEPLYVPDSLNVMELLQAFKRHRQFLALVVDEYGALQGLVTLHDVVEAMVGDISSTPEARDRDVITLQDGSYLVDGTLSIARLRELTGVNDTLEGEEEGEFHTAAGLVMARLARIPLEGDVLEQSGWRLEVVDMDRHRIDKLRLSRL